MTINIEDLLNDPSKADDVRRMFADIDDRIEKSQINYRFMWQMMGEDRELPNQQVLAMIIGSAYAQQMREWDGQDMFLPILFAVLTTREVMRNDH